MVIEGFDCHKAFELMLVLRQLSCLSPRAGTRSICSVSYYTLLAADRRKVPRVGACSIALTSPSHHFTCKHEAHLQDSLYSCCWRCCLGSSVAAFPPHPSSGGCAAGASAAAVTSSKDDKHSSYCWGSTYVKSDRLCVCCRHHCCSWWHSACTCCCCWCTARSRSAAALKRPRNFIR